MGPDLTCGDLCGPGRVSAFTAGWENPHQVEPVTEGARFALTVAFTCDPSQAIADPERRTDPL